MYWEERLSFLTSFSPASLYRWEKKDNQTWSCFSITKDMNTLIWNNSDACSLNGRWCLLYRPLRCSVCSDHLTNWYYEKDGKLYCRKHYWEKFGELCHGCSLHMTGPAMVSPPHLDSILIFTVLISSEAKRIDFAGALKPKGLIAHKWGFLFLWKAFKGFLMVEASSTRGTKPNPIRVALISSVTCLSLSRAPPP